MMRKAPGVCGSSSRSSVFRVLAPISSTICAPSGMPAWGWGVGLGLGLRLGLGPGLGSGLDVAMYGQDKG